MKLVRQVFCFAGVGLLATALHVLVAVISANLFDIAPQLANLCGFAAAVIFSYFGQGRLTFDAELHHGFHAPRFAASALTGLAISTTITEIVVVRMGASFELGMALVALAVPLATFTLMRFWVFKSDC